MQNKWFAVSASVCKEDREEGKFTIINKPIPIKANSAEEACGIGIKEMHKLFPVAEGWYNHQASAVEVPASNKGCSGRVVGCASQAFIYALSFIWFSGLIFATRR